MHHIWLDIERIALIPYNVFMFIYHWFVATYHLMNYLSNSWGQWDSK
jgi:hypothetical protein